MTYLYKELIGKSLWEAYLTAHQRLVKKRWEIHYDDKVINDYRTYYYASETTEFDDRKIVKIIEKKDSIIFYL